MEQLYQDDPRIVSTYTRHKNRSLTNSLESYQNGACKQTSILRWNGRVPTKEIVIHFLDELSPEDIINHRTKVFRYIKEHGIEAVANLELTKGEDDKPNNTVHSHVLTDDQRSEDELRELFNTACLRSGLASKNFRVDFRLLWNGYTYFKYFTKYDYIDKVILFQVGTGLQKFYEIGTWFSKSKPEIWDEIKAYMKEKDGIDPDDADSENDPLIDDECIDCNNVDFEQTPQTPDEEKEAMQQPTPQQQSAITYSPDIPPASYVELIERIADANDVELRDWRRVAFLDEPPLIYMNVPRWLYNARGPLRQDLLQAIDRRLRRITDAEIKEFLDSKTERYLYDLVSRLQGKPKAFGTGLPDLFDVHLRHGQIRQTLIDAIYARLYNAKDNYVVRALRMNHNITVNRTNGGTPAERRQSNTHVTGQHTTEEAWGDTTTDRRRPNTPATSQYNPGGSMMDNRTERQPNTHATNWYNIVQTAESTWAEQQSCHLRHQQNIDYPNHEPSTPPDTEENVPF